MLPMRCGPLLKKREKWRTPSCFHLNVSKKPRVIPSALIGPTRLGQPLSVEDGEKVDDTGLYHSSSNR
jgi:hypothetical protein